MDASTDDVALAPVPAPLPTLEEVAASVDGRWGGASPTPFGLTPLFVDFENVMSRDVKLSKMTLRQYLAAAPVLEVSWALGDEPVQHLFSDDPTWADWVAWAREVVQSEEVCWVSHNAAFDVRDARFGWTHRDGPLAIPQPRNVFCTLELAHCAWPNQPGGYSLKKLAQTLGLGLAKLDLDLASRKTTREARVAYCSIDTELCRRIWKLAVPRIPERELLIAKMANDFRELHFVVKPEKVAAALEQFTAAASGAMLEAFQHLDLDGDEAKDDRVSPVGWQRKPGTLGPDDPGQLRSIKPHKMKELLLDRLGFDAHTISYKKLNPAHLADNARAANALKETSRANKALSHTRRVGVFASVAEVDAELGFFRAHTGRFSSPSTGRGLNLHNLPKNDPAVAKPVRQMFELPDGCCFVRADLANVEYRIEGWMSGCLYTEDLFTRNVLADPYAAFGTAATGRPIDKANPADKPARQLFKAAVLGLGFIMGVGTWMSQLMLLISDPKSGITLDDLRATCAANGWGPVSDRWVRAQQTRLHAPWEVGAVAYHTRNKFHEIHPEFARLAKWLMRTVELVSSALDPAAEIARQYTLPGAPDPSRLWLEMDNGLAGKSLRALCGGWSRTVAWRDIGLGETPFGFVLSTVQAGTKPRRKITPNIVIENVVQSCARNAACAAKLELRDRGWPYILSVHDELLLVVPRERTAVLKAHQDLVEVLGPSNQLGYGWAAVVNPDEINCSVSLYEDEKFTTPRWWAALRDGDERLLDVLP